MLKRRIDLWLPAYLAGTLQRLYHRLARTRRHTHIVFLVCDHFEPAHAADAEQAAQRMKTWHSEYAKFQERCRSEFGTTPLHSWFYPPHHGYAHLATLANMAYDGLGEVELHYHHNGDTAITLERDLRATIAEYNHWGLLLESGATPHTSFGFIHGDWALGNSCDGKYCGVNDELTILQKLGCWADLTMPSSSGPSQTRKVNSIYYAKGDPHRPKSHDWGINAKVGKTDTEGLMLMQGPIGINFGAPSYPRIENASLTSENWGRADRIRYWINCNVHVRGRPEWLFVKLHSHGAIEKDFPPLFGEQAMQMHRVLNKEYNDGKRYSLHYVTARQAYNIAKAAEAGHSGNPADYLDFKIPLPATAFYAADARHTLDHCNAEHLKLSGIESSKPVHIRTRVGPIGMLQGSLASYEVDAREKRIWIEANGIVELALRDGMAVDIVEGAQSLAADAGVQRLDIAQRCVLSYR